MRKLEGYDEIVAPDQRQSILSESACLHFGIIFYEDQNRSII